MAPCTLHRWEQPCLEIVPITQVSPSLGGGGGKGCRDPNYGKSSFYHS